MLADDYYHQMMNEVFRMVLAKLIEHFHDYHPVRHITKNHIHNGDTVDMDDYSIYKLEDFIEIEKRSTKYVIRKATSVV